MYHTTNQRNKMQPPPGISQNEGEARTKLAQYVYEYLSQNGAPKAAETFKSEIQALADLSQINLSGDGPGFLFNWWSVFYDIYSATPDRLDKASNPTLEAKAFVELFHGYGSGMNGQFPTAPGMNVPPHGMDGFYRPPQPNVGSSSQSSPVPGYQNFGVPPRFPHQMVRPGMPSQIGPNGFVNNAVYDPRMMPNRMPPNPRGMTFPTNMRQVRPGMYGGPPFMDSPTTPTFPMQNGVGPMNGPGMPPMGMPNNPNYDPQMMMHHNPAGMNPQYMCDPSGSGPTSSAGPTNVNIGGSAPHSVPTNIGGPSSVGSGHGNMPASVSTDNPQMATSSLSNLLNGGNDMELKQSPGMNGGTPLQHNPGSQNPGSATGIVGPGSVHSQSGAPNSVNANNPQFQSTPQSHGAQLTPTSGAPENLLLDFQQNADPGNDDGKNKDEEISVIKSKLLEGYEVFS